MAMFDKAYPAKTKHLIFAVSAVGSAVIIIVAYLLVGISYRFHSYVGFALAIAFLAPAIILHFESRRKKRIDEALPRLLDDLAQSHEAGMTLLQALEESSKRKYGPITEELKKLTAQLSWGVEFEKAFKSFSDRISTALTIRITTLIMEALRLGGDLKTTFNSTAKFVREMLTLRKERESQLRPYLMIIYASSLVFIILVVVLYNSFFLPMAAKSTRFIPVSISIEESKSLLFDLAVIEAFFGGLTAGKLSQGKTLGGLKHSVILIFIVSIVLTILF